MISLPRMLRYMKPYKWIVIVGLLTVILPVAMELMIPRILQTLIDQGIEAVDMSVITRSSLIMLAAAAVGAVATVGQGFMRARLSQGMAYDMRSDLFKHIQTFSFGNLDQMQTGQLMTRVSSDVDVVRMFASVGLSLLLRALLMIIGSAIMIIITDWQLSLVMFVVLALAAILIRWIFYAARPLFEIVQEKLAGLNTSVQENLAGVHVVKAFVREKHEIDRFEGYNVDFMAENIKVGRLIAIALPILTVLTNIGLVGAIWYGGLDVIGGRLTIGQLIAFNSYLMIGMIPLLLLSNILTMVSRAEASATRVLEVLKTPPMVEPPTSPHQGLVEGAVTFENVSFHYGHVNGRVNGQKNGYNGHRNGNGTGNRDVLNGVSFTVKPGQQVALLGATGSGKSTLVNLIPRFYDVTGGRILIDGVDLRDWGFDALRSKIGVVLQQTLLFSGTIRENIAYGRPSASMEDVIAAAKAAQAHEFITAMPDGYDSLVEERGTNLSGGQRQRTAIARALLIQPSILIMDDSTSAVDMDTEFKIQEALDTLMANRTTFIIAQRITSVVHADQILVLDSGRIAAQGTHHELLQSSPIYQEIYDSQLGGQDMAGQEKVMQSVR